MDAEPDALEQDPIPVSPTPAVVRPRRPIGEIFVELGFITADQLEAALVVQRRTGARIGEILVEQGSLTRLDLASALAEHWEPRRPEPTSGGHSLLKGTDPVSAELGSSAVDHAAVAELESRLRAAEERLRAEPADRQRWGLRRRSAKDTEASLRDEVAGIAGRLSALDDVEATLAELQLFVERLDAVRVGDVLATGARLAGIEAAVSAVDGLEERVRADVERDLAGHCEALAARLERTEARLDTVDARLAALALVETELRAELEELRERPRVVEADARLAGRLPVAGAAGWVAFAPTDDGYRLVELPGSEPELGATVEVAESEGPLVVTRYGRSPLPFDGRPCAYLDRA